LDARLKTLLWKKKSVAKSKEVKTGWSNWNRHVWQDLLRKAMTQKKKKKKKDLNHYSRSPD
jgi:hypothetical protein